MFACQECGREVYTVRNLCAACAPEFHAVTLERAENVKRATERYRAECGREALANWSDFERWAERVGLVLDDKFFTQAVTNSVK